MTFYKNKIGWKAELSCIRFFYLVIRVVLTLACSAILRMFLRTSLFLLLRRVIYVYEHHFDVFLFLAFIFLMVITFFK